VRGLCNIFSGNHRTGARLLALILACTYFSFRTELFEDEFAENCILPVAESGVPGFNVPSTNWETFDKDNAPKAFKVEPCLPLGLLATVPAEVLPPAVVPEEQSIIRDKSPPSFN